MRKTAITVPAKLLAQVDRAAKARGESRSRFIQRLLSEAVHSLGDKDFTGRLNAFFENEANANAYRNEAQAWDEVGSAWKSERW